MNLDGCGDTVRAGGWSGLGFLVRVWQSGDGWADGCRRPVRACLARRFIGVVTHVLPMFRLGIAQELPLRENPPKPRIALVSCFQPVHLMLNVA